MNENELINHISLCRSIEPSRDFMERSKKAILMLPQKHLSWGEMVRYEIVENLKFSFSLALASFLLVAVFGGFAYWNNLLPGKFTTQSRDLLTEAEKMNFGIELGEAEYFSESAKEITLLLGEIREPEKTPEEALLDQIIF